MTTRVLVADDEELIGICVRQSLELGLPDCAVDVAHSGEEALLSLADEPHDLIITDYHMPGAINGLDLVEEARRRDAKLPVILMTGFGPTGLRVKAAELAVDYLMQKPFEVDDLLAIASQLLSPQ
ncbi:MAG: response regulator [Anaerolineae bacterium]|jgi:DNA-binding response OmpR family regulator